MRDLSGITFYYINNKANGKLAKIGKCFHKNCILSKYSN
jgi:hypothetical protein